MEDEGAPRLASGGADGVVCKGRTRGDAPTNPVVTEVEMSQERGLVLRIEDTLPGSRLRSHRKS